MSLKNYVVQLRHRTGGRLRGRLSFLSAEPADHALAGKEKCWRPAFFCRKKDQALCFFFRVFHVHRHDRKGDSQYLPEARFPFRFISNYVTDFGSVGELRNAAV